MNNFRRRRVFLGSLMDWLDPKVPVEWLADVLQVIRECPGLDFLFLTKRPEQFKIRLQAVKVREQYTMLGLWADEWLRGTPPANVWLGVSVEDKQGLDERLHPLLQIPAKVRFVSVEPLLERIKLPLQKNQRDQPECNWTSPLPFVDWIIVGGESGPHRRDCGVEAIMDVAEQCRAAGVQCFVKQDCAARPGMKGRLSDKLWRIKQFPRS